ncbi:GRAS family transcription factor [Rhynchospora pubera]|uniref:GRAS family transcription factor n=1 Tax=Rhynchospora pubera TaxID=906938 RepID=A0AAV8HK69_9POAL|nr:GRAS family transcription factor [Rhynchospora pubera]
MDTSIYDFIPTVNSQLKLKHIIPPLSPISPQTCVSSSTNHLYSSDDLPSHTGFYDLTQVLITPDPDVSTTSLLQTPLNGMDLNQHMNPQSDLSEDPLIFSDIALNYINSMLMEDDVDEKFEQYPENPALLAAQKPFLDILQSNSLSSPGQPPLPSIDSSESPDNSFADSLINYNCSSCDNDNSPFLVDNVNTWSFDLDQYFSLQTATLNPHSVDYSSLSSISSANNDDTALDVLAFLDESLKTQPVWQFNKGVEEANRFLPNEEKLIIDVEANMISNSPPVNIIPEKIQENETAAHRGKKHVYTDDALDSEEIRFNKQLANNPEESVLARDLLDKVLLCDGETCSKGVKELREALQHETAKHSNCNHSKSNGRTKGRRNRHSQKDVVDLTTLLSQCAQAVATDDRRSATEFLKQLRQHSSVNGDANQRLAHYFADGLEARLAGTGSQIYQSFTMKPIASTDILRAYQLYHAASPFKKVSHFFSNQTVLDAAQNATAVHIIDYGIYHGFQWPCLIQRLSKRSGGPPKLRITGIDLPLSGFRPAERIEETGARLADYARTFNVPFGFKAIAARWESVKVEDLEIKKDELLVVNSLYRFKTLMDESVVVDSPRDTVLKTIRKMNPDVFIHGVVNGSYNTPFFVTRFREAIFHFSALFDMLETNVPKEDVHRQLLEKALFGREAINVISCEGLERVERPEAYKQWQVRNLKAGFKQLPLNPEIMKKAREKVQSCYHKDFIIDEDNRWLLQGWKGRILFALSTWRPSHRVH